MATRRERTTPREEKIMSENPILPGSKKEDKAKDRSGVKRYNLVIPEPLFNEVQQLADEENTTVVDLFRRFIKLGLMVAKITRTPDTAFIIKEGDREREIIFFP
jgi:hypothetical protein